MSDPQSTETVTPELRYEDRTIRVSDGMIGGGTVPKTISVLQQKWSNGEWRDVPHVDELKADSELLSPRLPPEFGRLLRSAFRKALKKTKSGAPDKRFGPRIGPPR